jgi:hypothetical protein
MIWQKLSDLESKFNSEALGSIAHCETGLKKTQQGLLSSATTFNNCLMDLNRTEKLQVKIFRACLIATLGVGVTPKVTP